MFGANSRFPLLSPYELHKKLINHYVLNKKGATERLKRDTSRDKTDFDVIRENHKFVWEDDDNPLTWEQKLAKKYYDKLFKEYCICDLSRYKENKVAMRWQTEPEMIVGKGQFVCGSKNCTERDGLRTWEVNFGYIEHGEKKNTLVKLRLCTSCSSKLNYKSKKNEVKRSKSKLLRDKSKHGKTKKRRSEYEENDLEAGQNAEEPNPNNPANQDEEDEEELNAIWRKPVQIDTELSREEEFEKYLQELLF